MSQVTYTDTSLTAAKGNLGLDISAIDQGESPVTLAAANAAATAAAAAADASNLAAYGSINGVTQTSAANTWALTSGANTINIVVGSAAVTDSFDVTANPTSVTFNISGTATGALSIAKTGSQTSNTSLIVNDALATNLTIDSMHGNHLSSATFNNTGSATLTESGITSGLPLASVAMTGTGAENFTNITSANAGFALSDSSSAAVTITGLTASGGGTTDSITNSGAGLLTIDTATMTAGASTLDITNSGSGGIADTTGFATVATTVSLTNTGSAALDVIIGASSMSTLAIGGVGTSTSGTISATVTDTLAGTLTINDTQSATAGAAIVALGTSSTVTGLTVSDSSTGTLGLSAFTDNGLTSATFDNTGSAALTASGITDNSLATINIGGVGTSVNGTISATVTDTLAGTLTINDTQSATAGAAIVALGTSSTVTGLTVVDSSASALTLSAATDASLTTATFGNTGSATLTVNTLTAAALATVSMTGTGAESVAITNGSTAMAITDSNTNTSTAITLGTHTGHIDTVNSATTSAFSVTGFVEGTGNDVTGISISHVNGTLDNGSGSAVTAGSASLVSIASGTPTTLGTQNVVEITGTISGDAALLTAIEGGTAITFGGSVTAGNGVIFTYTTAADTHVVEVIQGTTGTAVGAGSIVHDIVTLVGTATASVAGNFHFNA